MKEYIPDCGDLIWFDFDPQAGREQGGRRPALVLSSRFFNTRTSVAYVCPITSKIKGYAFEVPVPRGMTVRGVVLTEHMRSLDWRARNAIFIEKAPDDLLAEVRAVVGSIAGILE